MRTREKVRVLLEEGKGVKEIARLLGLNPATITYHKAKLGYPLQRKCATRYDWPAIQAYYDEGHSRRECQARFGLSHSAFPTP